jgi:hypothetical protein
MKKFILKTSIIFLFSLLLFRFTVVSFVNEYQQKFIDYSSSSYLKDVKKELFKSINESNDKDKILNSNDAIILSTFIKKILNELDLK